MYIMSISGWGSRGLFRGARTRRSLGGRWWRWSARAGRYEDTDWARIASLYDRLRTVLPSPVVELNRAIAHGMAFGPEAGLELLDSLAGLPVLQGYAPLPAARGDCLFRLGRLAEAKAAFRQAAELTRNSAERAFLLNRALACDPD